MTTHVSLQDYDARPHRLGGREFAALAAFMMSIIAVAINIMLPALPVIGTDLGVTNANNQQMIVTILMAGIITGQIVFGPLSDKMGRKPLVIIGLLMFMVGGVVCGLATSMSIMLAGRLLQGFGASAVRILVISIIRDLYEGRAMASMFSLVLSLFVVMPCFAPMIGQAIMSFNGWRMIFFLQVGAAVLVLLWFGLRQGETLNPENKRPFTLKALGLGMKETLFHATTRNYIIAIGLISAVYNCYLFSAQQIFQDVFHVGTRFVYYFALLALVYGAGNNINFRLVIRFGAQKIVHASIIVLGLASVALLVTSEVFGKTYSLMLFMALISVVFLCISFLFGNMNSLAMQPLGRMAGMAASVVSLFSGCLGWFVGAYAAHSFDGTIIPFAMNCFVCSVLAWVAIRFAFRSSSCLHSSS